MKNIFDIEDIIEEKRHHSTPNFKWGECSVYVQDWVYLGTICISSTVWLKMSTTINGTKIIGNDADGKLNTYFSDIQFHSQNQAYAVNDGPSEVIVTEENKELIVINDVNTFLNQMGYCLDCFIPHVNGQTIMKSANTETTNLEEKIHICQSKKEYIS